VIGFLLRLRRMPAAVGTLWRALSDRRTPWAPRLVALGAAAYAIWPLDLIPDVIPLAGMLDEMVVLPLLLMLAGRLVPAPILAEIERDRAQRAALPGAAPRPRWRWWLLALLAVAALLWWTTTRQAA
jgi:uncharacterized membrane protein YkvA (DUF1232 family)